MRMMTFCEVGGAVSAGRENEKGSYDLGVDYWISSLLPWASLLGSYATERPKLSVVSVRHLMAALEQLRLVPEAPL
jgi:hypothetical protein